MPRFDPRFISITHPLLTIARPLYLCQPCQLPDTDAPFVFSLPDNIERSLQRVTSSGVIRQLRALSTLDAEANKFDREKWRAQVSLLTLHFDAVSSEQRVVICSDLLSCIRFQ